MEGDSSLILTNCVFSGNVVTDSGGAIVAQDTSMVMISGCSFIGNKADYGVTRYY